MKRAISMLLILATLFSLFSCASPSQNSTDTTHALITQDSIYETLTNDMSTNDGNAPSQTPNDTQGDNGDITTPEDNGDVTHPGDNGDVAPPEDDGIVSIDLLDCNGAYIDTVLIEEGTALARPENPTKANADFVDWYADPACTVLFDFSNVITANTVIYAKWLEKPSYRLGELLFDIQANTVSVSADVDAACNAIVRLIDEDYYFSDSYTQGEQYLNVPQTVIPVTPFDSNEEDTESTPVYTGSLSFVLPQYFVAEVVLISQNGDALCDPIVSILHTLRYEQFLNTTIHDFSDDNVVVFGTEENNNFGVLADDVRILTAQSIVKNVSEETLSSTYRITAPSEPIGIGDKIFISLENGDDSALFIVKSVTESNGIFTVVPIEATEDDPQALSALYKFLKVDTSSYCETSDDETAEAQSRAAGSGTHSDSKKVNLYIPTLSFNLNNITISGKPTGSITLYVTIAYDLTRFGDSYFSIKFKTETDFKMTVTFSVSAKGEKKEVKEKELKGPKVPVPLNVPGLVAFAGVSFVISAGVTGSLVIEFSFNSEVEHFYDTRTGKSDPITIQKTNSTVTNCEGEFFVRACFKPYIGISFWEKIARAEVGLLLGAAVVGKTTGTLHGENEADHRCLVCIDGGVYSVFEVEGSLGVNLFPFKDKSEDNKLELSVSLSYVPKMLNVKIPGLSFYWSIFAEETFQKFGLGECPNRSPLVTIHIYPYSENYYPEYDPESGLPYPGINAPASAYKYPWDLEIVNTATGRVVGTIINLAAQGMDEETFREMVKNVPYPYFFFNTNDPHTDENGNVFYPAEVYLPVGSYVASSVYYKTKPYVLPEMSSDAYYDAFSSMASTGDYGDIAFTVKKTDKTQILTQSGDNKVAIYPENRAYKTKTYSFVYRWNVKHCACGALLTGPYHCDIGRSCSSEYLTATPTTFRVLTRFLGGKSYFSTNHRTYRPFFSSHDVTIDENGHFTLTLSYIDMPGELEIYGDHSNSTVIEVVCRVCGMEGGFDSFSIDVYQSELDKGNGGNFMDLLGY